MKLPNPETDLHPHARTNPPPCSTAPNRFLGFSFRKFNFESKLVGMQENSTFLVPTGILSLVQDIEIFFFNERRYLTDIAVVINSQTGQQESVTLDDLWVLLPPSRMGSTN
ncbi:hypothetical protein TNCV_487651 [Trichonephila clavipes]|nr:hypothetical protein TNCV_487651 [Trichonephila clavipes]